MWASFRPRRARRWITAPAGAYLAAAIGCGAADACALTLIEAPETVRITYDPFSLSRPAGQLDVTLANTGDTACELDVAVLDDTEVSIPTINLGGVDVEFRPREGAALTRDAARPGVFSFEIAPGTEMRAELDALPRGETVAEAGEHQADLRLEVRQRNGAPLLPQIRLQAVLVAPPRAQVNVAGAAGAFGTGATVEVVDFGDAVTGAVKRTFLQVRANSRATVTFASEHEGAMRHLALGDKVPSVPYQVTLDGAPLELSKPFAVEIDTPRTLAGRSLAMDFTLGELTGQVSGQYEDVITIDITPG